MTKAKTDPKDGYMGFDQEGFHYGVITGFLQGLVDKPEDLPRVLEEPCLTENDKKILTDYLVVGLAAREVAQRVLNQTPWYQEMLAKLNPEAAASFLEAYKTKLKI